MIQPFLYKTFLLFHLDSSYSLSAIPNIHAIIFYFKIQDLVINSSKLLFLINKINFFLLIFPFFLLTILLICLFLYLKPNILLTNSFAR